MSELNIFGIRLVSTAMLAKVSDLELAKHTCGIKTDNTVTCYGTFIQVTGFSQFSGTVKLFI